MGAHELDDRAFAKKKFLKSTMSVRRYSGLRSGEILTNMGVRIGAAALIRGE